MNRPQASTGLAEIHEDNNNENVTSTTLELRIIPLSNSTTSVFIAGPHISSKYLDIHKSKLRSFLGQYKGKISKAVRRTMEIWPPNQYFRAVSLCHTEFITSTWKSLYIESTQDPNPLSLIWTPTPETGTGVWGIPPFPTPGIILRGGFGNYEVKVPN
jgi:hypothetical protein